MVGLELAKVFFFHRLGGDFCERMAGDGKTFYAGVSADFSHCMVRCGKNCTVVFYLKEKRESNGPENCFEEKKNADDKCAMVNGRNEAAARLEFLIDLS